MKTKFLLTLLSVGGLLVSTNSAFAYSPSPAKAEITNLSQTIADLVKLDADSHSLVEMAIDRALLAQGENCTSSSPKPIVNGKIANPNPNPTPIINGTVPVHNPLVIGRLQRPQSDRPLINGIIINPHTQPEIKTIKDKPLINGIIVNPNHR